MMRFPTSELFFSVIPFPVEVPVWDYFGSAVEKLDQFCALNLINEIQQRTKQELSRASFAAGSLFLVRWVFFEALLTSGGNHGRRG